MDLLYFCTFGNSGPNKVSRKIIEHLIERIDDLPFDNIKLVVPTKDEKLAMDKFKNIEIVRARNFGKYVPNSVVHIPITPFVAPNKKFLLHMYSLLKNTKLIVHLRGDLRTEMRIKLKKDHSINLIHIPSYILLPQLLRSADVTITHSYLMQNILNKYKVEKSIVIPHGIDDFWNNKYGLIPIELKGNPTFFYHGRLSPEKGVDLLLEGFARSIKSNYNSILYIGGSGDQMNDLKKLCMKLGIQNNVTFLGNLNDAEIKTYLHHVNASFYPSLIDNFPLAILEALSCANGPVFFSKFAGIFDFVKREGYNLHTFKPSIDNICKIFEDIDKGTVEDLIDEQRMFANRYAWDKVIDMYIEMYNDIL